MVCVIGIRRGDWTPRDVSDRPQQVDEVCRFVKPTSARKANSFVEHYNRWAMEEGWPIWAVIVPCG